MDGDPLTWLCSAHGFFACGMAAWCCIAGSALLTGRAEGKPQSRETDEPACTALFVAGKPLGGPSTTPKPRA
jgi:hypothetical protein